MSKQSKKKMTWNDMSTGRKVVVLVVGTVQFALAVTAWRDLAKRPAEQVNGPKGMWAAIIAVNWIGPIAYFVRGRRTDFESLEKEFEWTENTTGSAEKHTEPIEKTPEA